MSEDKPVVDRQRLVAALVALVEHVGKLATAQSLETERLVMDAVEAADIRNDEFHAALTAPGARTLSEES